MLPGLVAVGILVYAVPGEGGERAAKSGVITVTTDSIVYGGGVYQLGVQAA